ncbi:MAG: hypothetical protein IR164_16035 [Devosia sp.]|uniref:hypothetical protein n=1 Tax=Devosia sp. TaxID=1871048 RepID=UPI0019F609D0|nr:hypothetical protein [Devosia sp.]MBF0680438.1 hypothetical protein [Devosia sp.]
MQESQRANGALLHPPRFMTDEELRLHFGLSERALNRLRCTARFPRRDSLINKTDRRAVEHFFDRRAGISSPVGAAMGAVVDDGEENFN